MRNLLIVSCWLWCCVAVLGAQTDRPAPDQAALTLPEGSLTYRALGTGQTTGHIADLIVQSSLPEDIIAAAQWCFIPGHSGFQSYVARIPEGITIPVQGTATIPLIGYCTDISTPPVPAGQRMPLLTDWVPIKNAANTALSDAVTYRIFPGVPQAIFQPEQAGFLRPLSAFNAAQKPDKVMPELLYPSTDTPIGGTYAVNEQPQPVASMIVAAAQRIEEIVAVQQLNKNLTTPFSGDPLREREAIVQQTIWIMMATLAGESYTQEDFAQKIYDQYQRNTGTLLTGLAQPQKDKLTNGVVTFWRTFLATGKAAQVFR